MTEYRRRRRSKTKARRRPRRRHARERRRPGRSFPGLLGASLFLGLIAASIAILYLFPVPPKVASKGRPPYEEFHAISQPVPPDDGIPETAITLPSSSETGTLPAVALIIDDMGYDPKLDMAFLKIPAPLSFAFLPYAPFTKPMVKRAHSNLRNVLVHLPMEPESGAVDPGPGVLVTSMTPATLLDLLNKEIDAVPGAIGVNNHMGSKFTKDKRAMEVLMSGLKKRGLFFIDSRTTKYSVAYDTARVMGVPSMSRAVFLDHDHDEKEITRQLYRLVKIAKARGQALGIGHPFPETYRVLVRELPKIRKEVRIVPVELLVRKGS